MDQSTRSNAVPPVHPIVVVMGVSGSGKTTIGSVLAAQAQIVFVDGDDFHSAANRQKMAAGVPLIDEDRAPWLQALNGLLVGWWKAGVGGVLACSALKASYREKLAEGTPTGTIHFVLLEASRGLLAARLAARVHGYMNPVLLDSQLATLEVPKDAYAIVNDREPNIIAAEILRHIVLQE